MRKISSGKVREIYELTSTELVIITTDRLSAFDVVLPTLINGKGIALNSISNYWFDLTKEIIPNHIISSDINDMPVDLREKSDYYSGRTVLVKKLNMLPYEFIVRGYIFGNMWNAYEKGEPFCGHIIDGDYKLAQKLKNPIVTPSVKNNIGHDEYVSKQFVIDEIGVEKEEIIFDKCMELYTYCSSQAAKNGIIIADTKFEFGFDETGNLVLGDELFTPDCSRFWDMESYKMGESPNSYDKQFVRDWLIANKLDGVIPGQEIPIDIKRKTEELYKKCCIKLTGKDYSIY